MPIIACASASFALAGKPPVTLVWEDRPWRFRHHWRLVLLRNSEIVAAYFRKRRTLHFPITLNVVLMVLNIALMVCWIITFSSSETWPALTIGTIAFALILIGLSIYLFLSIKNVQLNRRQANFVDSVTHELKTPISALRLYLETLQMRDLDEKQRDEFYQVMESELRRLNRLISQLLEVGRLGEIGQLGATEDIELEPLLRRCAQAACAHHNCIDSEVFNFDMEPAVIHAGRMAVEMVFGNLLDNAVKYAGENPVIDVEVRVGRRGRVVTRIRDNGQGVPADMTKKIFQMFYRGGNELERTQKGTGVGLYIVRTLVHILKGKVKVHDRYDAPGSIFEVELPGRTVA